MKYCGYCKTVLEDDAKYCYECGASQEQKDNAAGAENDNGQNTQTGGNQQQYGGQQYDGYNQQQYGGQQYDGYNQQQYGGQQYDGYNQQQYGGQQYDGYNQQQYDGQQYGGYNNQHPYNDYNRQQYESTPPVKKSNGGKIAIGIVCGVIAFFVAFVGAIIIFSNDTKEFNTEYTEYLEKYGLTDTINKYTIDDENYAVIQKSPLGSEIDFVASEEYVCSGDKIERSRGLIFYDISSLDSFERSALEISAKDNLSKFDDLKCCQISYFNVDEKYFAVMVDVDFSGDKTSLNELYDAGLIDIQNAEYVSCSKAIADAIKDGAIPKYIDN